MCYVSAERRIFSDLTVTENLIVGKQAPRENAVTWSEEILFDLLPNLAERRNNRGKELSGGEQQMLTIARNLMGNPYFVLMDEPSEGVAPVIVEEMVRIIRQLKQEGLPILLSEQNLHFAQAVSDRAIIIESGSQMFFGTPEELSSKPEIRDAYLAAWKSARRASRGDCCCPTTLLQFTLAARLWRVNALFVENILLDRT